MPSPPTSLPPGSWGGDADPQTSSRRAQFEVDLQRQTEARQAALAGQPVVVGQPILGPPPMPKPPLEGGLYIPPDLGAGGDLISSMGEEEVRTANAHRQAIGLPPEQIVTQPVSPDPPPTIVMPAMQPTVATPASGDLAGLLGQVARVIQGGTIPMMRHLRDRIRANQLTPAELGEALGAASEIVTAAVAAMTPSQPK